jgi:2,3-bisphosphoglycerate-independent phosphoglycerate mutase
MDRDKRWERVQLAYDLLVNGKGKETKDVVDEIRASYIENVTDEFIKPIVKVDENGEAVGKIKDGDVVVCFNFRTDRCREITQVLTQENFHEFNMHTLDLHYVTMTEYDATFKGVEVIFTKDNLENTLGEVVARAGRKQIRIAETEKYPHVSFFYSGGREKEFEGESRIMINSPKVATYDLQPEMSAFEIKDAILPEIEKGEVDFVCLNFANTDMVGHTGVWEAAMKAAETVDTCVKEIAELALEKDYTIFLTADHGNSDFLVNADGSPNTAHSMNLVPFFLIGNDVPKEVRSGKLGDVAPTILSLMGLDQPEEMTGEVLY